jgi:choline kinase
MTDSRTRAIVLAAGQGLRLATGSDGRPKCLLEVGGRALLDRLLDLLIAGRAEPLVVVGYGADGVALAVGDRARLVENAAFDRGSIVSLRIGLAEAPGPVVFLDADVLCHSAIVGRLLRGGDSSLLVDGGAATADEGMVAVAREGRVEQVARRSAVRRGAAIVGESVGFARIAAIDVPLLRRALDETIAIGGPDQEWEAGFTRFCALARVGFDLVDGLPWTEIDFPEDLARARDDVWPAISAGT